MSGGRVIKDSEKRITQNFRDGKTPWDGNMQTYLREKVQPLRLPLVVSMFVKCTGQLTIQILGWHS